MRYLRGIVTRVVPWIAGGDRNRLIRASPARVALQFQRSAEPRAASVQHRQQRRTASSDSRRAEAVPHRIPASARVDHVSPPTRPGTRLPGVVLI